MAHPHNRVEQQAHLTIASDRAIVVYYLAASGKDGVHLFDHLDTDGDRVIGKAERRAFGSALVRNTALTIDGRRSALSLSRYAFPSRAAMRAGGGVIRVEAAARGPHSKIHITATSLAIGYNRLASRWFIQPFVSREFRQTDRRVEVLRPAPSNVTVKFKH